MKVDVVISAYGKPWQTLCTLKSLMKVSGEHIDKIYLIEEREQPFGENNIKMLLDKFDNLVHYIPKCFISWDRVLSHYNTPEDRYVVRYQYGIEMSDKKYFFVTHNDILYTNDIIGNMLNEIGDNVGIGLIGQCWNCPAFSANVCDGNRFETYKPTYDEAIRLVNTVRSPRTHPNQIDRNNPMPLPECRLNEFAALIDREITMKECTPNGNTPLFAATIMDTADAWFKSLFLKGYKFKNYDILKDCKHPYYLDGPGQDSQRNHGKYIESEMFAKKYYEENLQ